MSLRARWLQAGGLLALSVALFAGADLAPFAECRGRTGLQPYVCIDYGDPWAAPLAAAGALTLAGGLGLLWGLAGAWRAEHSATFRLLLLVGLAGAALVVAAWSLGAPDLMCVGVEHGSPPDPPCRVVPRAWSSWAFVGGGALLGGAAVAAAGLAVLTSRAS